MRVAIGVSAVVQGGAYLSGNGNPALLSWAVGCLAVASGALLVVGFLTPAAATLSGLGGVAAVCSWFPATAPNLLDHRPSVVLVVVVASAVVLLGPGAYSLDARLFGRREIIIPHASRPPRP